MTLNITNEISLNSRFSIIEIQNTKSETYEYYLYCEGYPLMSSFSVPYDGRMSEADILRLYANGYFDADFEDIESI